MSPQSLAPLWRGATLALGGKTLVFRDAQILDRLTTLEQRLGRLEQAMIDLNALAALRSELTVKQERIDALAAQGLQVVDQLTQARARITQLESSQEG